MWWRSTDVVEKLLYGGISHMWWRCANVVEKRYCGGEAPLQWNIIYVVEKRRCGGEALILLHVLCGRLGRFPGWPARCMRKLHLLSSVPGIHRGPLWETVILY